MMKSRRKSRGPVTTNERRTNRSDVPQEAARLYLEAAAERQGIRAVALAGEDGLLIAGTSGDVDLNDLAALGAACGNGAGDHLTTEALLDRVAGADDLYASSVPIGGDTYYLTSVGTRVRSVKDAGAALSRILAPRVARSQAI
ncbi:MAG: hypothetical protein HUU21_04770 [Polyangiaceae bacterium]|nr:hypothetical protein [Polyangiaceae bacterium]NUQ72851.1 hypothetical protein [Polyangiaceae bacterium]